MPPKKGKESVQRKSAAEFFTENQPIAGFDNPGKSLYTTIRELVENSLDAAESLGVPPRVELTVQELSQKEIDGERGMQAMDRIDEEGGVVRRKQAPYLTPGADTRRDASNAVSYTHLRAHET